MSIFAILSKPFKNQSYALITALLVAGGIALYLLVLLPRQTARADARNMAVFAGIQNQLKGFIEDKVKNVDKKEGIAVDVGEAKLREGASKEGYVLDTISIASAYSVRRNDSQIIVTRLIPYKIDGTPGTIESTVDINLREFIRKISPMTNFTSFYICDVNNPKNPLLATNVPLIDQDSIRQNLRKTWPFEFGSTVNRYYGNQLTVGNLKLFIAVGLQETEFQAAARSVSPDLLIFTLLVIVLLFLSITLVKPVLSSRDERVEQRDLIKVVFTVGALAAVLMVFGMVSGWNSAIKQSTYTDLRKLAETVNQQFQIQFEIYKTQGKKAFTPERIGKIHKAEFRENVGESKDDTTFILNEYLDYFDNYFRFDKKGYVTADLSKDTPGLKRNYSDREYFKLMTDSLKVRKAILRSVLSRETNRHQWIYVEKDSVGFIRGFGFRDVLTNFIDIPPDTDYLLVDNTGNVLMQSDPDRNLYQNLRNGAGNQIDLQNVLSGRYSGQFYLKYQGTSYQVYSQKLQTNSEIPIYILAMRDLTFNNNLALFAFCNGFIIALFYGILLFLLSTIYSAILTAGHVKLLSKDHFYYLFPDGSKSEEYRRLFWINSTAIVVVVASLVCINAPAALVISVLTGCSIALLNLAVLKSKYGAENFWSLILIVTTIAIITFFLIFNDWQLYATLFFLLSQVVIVYYLRMKAGTVNNTATDPKVRIMNTATDKHNTGGDIIANVEVQKADVVDRRAYIKLMTAMLGNHFVLFPFILVCSIYVSELNDFATWHCSSVADSGKFCLVSAHGCDCEPEVTDYKYGYETMAKIADVGIINRPGELELSKFTFKELKKGIYISADMFFSIVNTVLLLLGTAFLTLLIYMLVNYYCGRFFFYELMVAAQKGYFKIKHDILKCRRFLSMAFEDDPDTVYELSANDKTIPDSRKRDVEDAVAAMHADGLPPVVITEFVKTVNLQEFSHIYEHDWINVPPELRFILFDFARDNFVNYKDKDEVIRLMEMQYIVQDEITGRLMLRNPNFRKFLLTKVDNDKEFITKYKEDSKDGAFGKLRLPIIIIAVSLLMLMLYLNKDSYNKLIAFSGGIAGTLALVNQILALQKKT